MSQISLSTTGCLGGGGVPGPPGVLSDVEVVATGLLFPEGPVAMPDGSILVVEMHRGTVSRVDPSGTVDVVADCGGGPNGLAIGPEGAIYVCNNGGRLPNYAGGRIERVDPSTGRVEVLYTECDGEPLSGPNDIVFDDAGGFWFTDLGKGKERARDYGKIFYAQADGSGIKLVFEQLAAPNGIGLSADGSTLYFAETWTCRLYRRAITGVGEVEHSRDDDPDTLICGLPGVQWFDSLAVDRDGNVCVGTLKSGSITVASPDGSLVRQFLLPPEVFDPMPTNICFAGPDLTTAFITLSEHGSLVRCPWPPAP
jgi:gluconolactonase